MSIFRTLPMVAFLLVQFGCGGAVCEEEMCLVPAGSFMMGCDADSRDSCYPQHKVTLDAFLMDRTEVTYDAFMSCVDAGVCSHHMDDNTCGFVREYVSILGWETGDPRGEDDGLGIAGPTYRQAGIPMVCVTWEQARQYCEWAGKRLPTEAEWEKAARGTDERTYPWGNKAPSCDLALFCHNGQDNCGGIDPDKVCGRSPSGDSPYGLCDMAGNVREWVSDWLALDYYHHSPTENPLGPDDDTSKVVRGGGIWDVGGNIASYARAGSEPTRSYNWLGFRCAKSVVSE